MVAVDGPSGAGKSTFADRLQSALKTEVPVPVIHLDDLFPGWDGLAEIVPLLLRWVLEPLADGRNPRYQRYDWLSGQYAEWHDVPIRTDPGQHPVLIVEGVGSGSRACAPFLSLVVWVDAPERLRMQRGIERDGEAYRPHWERWARQEDVLFNGEDTADRADVVVDGRCPG